MHSVSSYIIFFIAIMLWYLYSGKNSYIHRAGTPGTATIIKIFKTGITKDSDYKVQYEIILDVNEGETDTYRTTIKKFFYPNETIPEVDTLIKVKIHPKDKYKLVLDTRI